MAGHFVHNFTASGSETHWGNQLFSASHLAGARMGRSSPGKIKLDFTTKNHPGSLGGVFFWVELHPGEATWELVGETDVSAEAR